MAIRTRDELIAQFNSIVGEDDTRDEVLEFMTDMTDSLNNNGSERISTLEREKDELDKSWRKKYRDAFLGNREDIQDEDETPKSFDDLFKFN